MNIFTNRNDKDYRSILRSHLQTHGIYGVKKTAIKLAVPKPDKINSDHKYTHCIRIDFFGISATTLFDKGNIVAKYSLYDDLIALLNMAEDLNKEGYFIRLRLLFAYPFSTGAYTRIQAETSSDRSSINDSKYTRNFQFVDQISEETFLRSSLVTTQSGILNVIQETVEHLGEHPSWQENSPNRFYLRFLPQDPKVCGLFINQSFFYDTYLLSKSDRHSNRCSYDMSPITHLTAEDGEVFKAFEDHFRYLWELDVTIDCDDGTEYQPGRRGSLNRVLPPSKITFESKASRIRDKNPNLTERESAEWKFGARNILNKYCCDLSQAPSMHSIFIACSWKKQGGAPSIPNDYAYKLLEWLEKDFVYEKDGNLGYPFQVKIMEASKGAFLSHQLYQSLEKSTLGLVLLTRDIESQDGAWFSKPNVYHELGFLMRHLGKNKVFLIIEDDVEVSANIQDIVYDTITGTKTILIYHTVIFWLYNLNIINIEFVDSAISNHKFRLADYAEKGVITFTEHQKILQEIKSRLKQIREVKASAKIM